MTREEKRIDAVLFDLDETLIDWSQRSFSWEEFTRPKIENIYAYLSAVAGSAGYTLPSQEEFVRLFSEHTASGWQTSLQTFSGFSFMGMLRQLLGELGLDTDHIDLKEALHSYSWEPLPGVALYKDTIPVLTELRRRGYKIGLVTNSFQPMWMRDIELESYGLLDLLDARVTSGDTGYMKPHPAIYWRTLGLLQTTPDRAVFVGDRPDHDIAGANEVGLTSVLIDPPHLNRARDGVVPDFTITTLGELLPILESLEEVENQ